MLIKEPKATYTEPFLKWMAKRDGNHAKVKELRTGVYRIGHYGASFYMSDYEHYPETTVGAYGVCDSVEQLLAACPELEASERKFIVTVTSVRKANQPKFCGWRWHKWGQYIGEHKPHREYLYDEPEIKEVLCFHIYEKLDNKK